MSGVNWGLGLSQDVGGNAFASFERGQEQRRVDDGRNAMAAYATNPNADTLKALAPSQPQFVMAENQKRQQQEQEQREKQEIGDALANPDPAKKAAARQRLAYTNSELYMKLGDNEKKSVDAQMKPIGQLAFNLLQLPDDQIGPATDKALANMQAQGFDTSGFKRTGDPRQDLLTVLAATGQLDEWEQFSKPTYTPVGEAGLAGFQYGKPIQQTGQPQNFAPQQQGTSAPLTKADYDKLPAGAQYTAPDGSIRTKPGGTSGNTGGGFRPVGIQGEQVTSTYRNPERNKAVGGVDNSFHTRRGSDGKPLARDSTPPPGMSMASYAALLRRQNPDLDVINEGDHVHMEPR